MTQLLWVFLGGGLGSLLRTVVSTRIVAATGLPWGTLLVNVVGCFLIGVVGELSAKLHVVPRELALPLSAGFIGGLTTFSSFAYEAVRLGEAARVALAVLYVSGSVLVGLSAVVAGMAAARLLVQG